MTRYVPLLRGINVGAAKRMAMADLREALAEAGFGEPRTLLQSGNVVLDSSKPAAATVAAVEQAIEGRFGFEVPVIVRTVDQLAAIVAADPFADVATDDSRYMVTFTSAKPKAAAVRELSAVDFSPEGFAVAEGVIYSWCPNRVHKSALIKAIEKSGVAPKVTTRNLSTVRKLLDLAREE